MADNRVPIGGGGPLRRRGGPQHFSEDSSFVRRGPSDDLSASGSPKMSAQPFAFKDDRDRGREPDQREYVDGNDMIVPIDDEQSGNVDIDAQTGVVTHDEGGSIVIDFGGMKSLRERQQDPDRARFRKFDANLAEDPRVPCAGIAARQLEGIDADLQARSEWEEMGNKGAEMLGVRWEDSSTEVSADGFISKVHHPLMLSAVIKNWARSHAELLPAAGPVKVQDDQTNLKQQQYSMLGPQAPLQAGQQPQGSMPQSSKPNRSELADALEKDMNHYLTVVDLEYYADTSRMLIMRALKGSQFKKVYWDPLERRPVSRWVSGSNLIVSNDASHLSKAGRVTERARVRQATVRRLQRIGWWRDVALIEPSPQATSTEQTIGAIEGIRPIPSLPADYPHMIYECYCELDDGPLAEDEHGYTPGFPLPYCVTIDKDSQTVLAIRRAWKQGDSDYRARRRYVHYGMVPGLGFYHWGFFHILGNPNRATTAMLREFIDAEMFASFPGGVVRKTPGSRTASKIIRPAPGQFAEVETNGDPIDQAIMAWPYKGSSANLMPGIEKMEALGKELAGNLELPVGEGRVGNVPVGTMMAYVDNISQVPSAIHKGDHASQREEFTLMRDLFEEDPDSLESEDGSRAWTSAMLRDKKLAPAADPNVPSAVHRYMQTSGLVQMAGLPQFNGVANQRAVWKQGVRVLGFSDSDEMTMPEPPPGAQAPPDPRVIAEQQKAQAQQQKTQLGFAQLQQKAQDTQREAANQSVEAEQRDRDRESEEKIQAMKLDQERMRDLRQHAREIAGGILDHHAEIRGQNLEHQRHQDTMAAGEQDRAQAGQQHAEEQATQREASQQKARQPTKPEGNT